MAKQATIILAEGKRFNVQDLPEEGQYNDQTEDNEYSITPKTFISRTLLSINGNLGRYVEKYKYEDNEVLRFGILASAVTKEKLDNEEIPCTAEKKKQGSTANQSGSSVSKTDQAVKHFSLEIESLKDAINHLLTTDSKTVLVDILERETKGDREVILNAKKAESLTVQTHTVLLYKNPAQDGTHEIVVIDPSNITFSSHLSSDSLHKQLSAINEKFGKISSPSGKLQIYAPDSKVGTGPRVDHYRDCVDIAVKLAFGFNKEGPDFSIVHTVEAQSSNSSPISSLTAEDIKALNVVKDISNVVGIDSGVGSLGKNPPSCKIKQVSDVKTAKMFCKGQRIINDSIKMGTGFLLAEDILKLAKEHADLTAELYSVYNGGDNIQGCQDTMRTKLSSSHEEIKKTLETNYGNLLSSLEKYSSELKKVGNPEGDGTSTYTDSSYWNRYSKEGLKNILDLD